QRRSLHRDSERVIGRGETRQVRDVLAQGLASIDGQIGEGAIRIVLTDEGIARRCEVRQVAFGPPVCETALRMKEAALVIETMADLMPDNGANSAVVEGDVGGRIEEWRLEDGGGKVQGILQRQINRVDDLRLHPPLLRVWRLVEFGEFVPV